MLMCFYCRSVGRKLVSDSRVKLKYQQHITNSFVDCNLLMRWCPAADCIYAAKVSDSCC